jgi:hypothetical protein
MIHFSNAPFLPLLCFFSFVFALGYRYYLYSYSYSYSYCIQHQACIVSLPMQGFKPNPMQYNLVQFSQNQCSPPSSSRVHRRVL